MKKLTIRVSDEEHEHLTEFCRLKDRSQNDVLRQLIRLLRSPDDLESIDTPIDETQIERL